MAKPLGVVLNFYANSKDAIRDINKLSGSVEGVGSGAKRNAGKLAGFAKAGIAGVAGAAATAAVALWDMTQAAAEDARSAEQLERVLKRTTDATNAQVDATADWIDKMQLSTHVADTELREALGKLASATGDATQAQELLALAVDTATARGESLDTVVRSLEKAVAGNTTALKKQMPWLDENKDGTLTLDEALQGLRGAYEGAAEAAADKDPFEKLRIVWDETQETLGTALLPKLEDLGEWLGSPDGQAAIEGWITATEDFATAMGDLADDLGPVVRLLKDVADAYGDLPGWMKKNPVSGLADTWENRPWNRKPNWQQNPNRQQHQGYPGMTVVVNNPKPERASDSVAQSIRNRRLITGSG